MTDAPNAGVKIKHKCLNKVTNSIILLHDDACCCICYRIHTNNWNAS